MPFAQVNGIVNTYVIEIYCVELMNMSKHSLKFNPSNSVLVIRYLKTVVFLVKGIFRNNDVVFISTLPRRIPEIIEGNWINVKALKCNCLILLHYITCFYVTYNMFISTFKIYTPCNPCKK